MSGPTKQSLMLFRLLADGLDIMNTACQVTAELGPSAGMEFIADYLNNTDGASEERVPSDWLSKWGAYRSHTEWSGWPERDRKANERLAKENAHIRRLHEGGDG